MRIDELAGKLTDWIRDQVTAAGQRGIVLGMSGGIDSSVVAVLSKRAFPDTTQGIILPCRSISEDEEHARLVAGKFQIPVRKVDLERVYDSLMDGVTGACNAPVSSLASANMKSRLRMLTLYCFANTNSFLVAGTGNRSEIAVGYFTKWGDSGVDLLPIGNLVKRQVRDLARYLGIPEVIIAKPPSAGLWQGQTDEAEMGVTYDQLDRFLCGESVDAGIKDRLSGMIRRAEHKRRMPAIPDF